MSKKSFVLYDDMWDYIEELDMEQRGVLLTAIYSVNNDKIDVSEMNKDTRIIYKMIRNQMHRDATKYEQIIEKRRQAGSKGGKSRAEKAKQTQVIATDDQANQANATFAQANQADTVTVNDTVTVTDNVTVTVNDTVGGPALDDDTTDSDFFFYGTLHNVRLTRPQYRSIMETFQSPRKLINKVSVWLPDAKCPPDDHFALVHRFALNDNWARKPVVEEKPDEPDPARGEFCSAPDTVKEKARSVLGGLSLVEA